MHGIKFGTDGWRAVIAEEFTFENLKLVTQGIANYLKIKQLLNKGVVVAYDNRFMAERFAEACCHVLLGNGVRVHMFRAPVPTPVAAFAIRHIGAGGALMITASHNPPEYNGIKFIPEYAGPALPETTDLIEREIDKVCTSRRFYELDEDEGLSLGLYREIDVRDEYFAHITSLLRTSYFKEHPLKVVADPMYGSGCGYLEGILERLGCEVHAINNWRDPMFGGSMPEPVERLLRDLSAEVQRVGADIGLALDGDADRFGIVDHKGNYVSANHFGPVLLEHLLNTRDVRGPVVRSVATTHMLDRIADRNEISVIETPVGFKYIGKAMNSRKCILGIEESGGLSICGHVPEKDGILACCLAAEMLAFARKSIPEICMDFYSKYGRVSSRRVDIQVSQERKPLLLNEMKKYKPSLVGGVRVQYSNETDGKKILLEDGAWILIRPSGTEPLFRLYIEAGNEEALDRIQAEVMSSLGFPA